MGKMYFLLGGQYSEFLLEKMRADAMFDHSQKVLGSCEGSLTQKGLLHYGFKLLFSDTAGVYDRFSKGN